MIRLMGRDAELAMMRSALDGVDRGFAALIICGEPGIGKTTVWQHGIAEARARGYHVTCCRPAESERLLSFSGLADLMESVPGNEPVLFLATARSNPGEALPAGLGQALGGDRMSRMQLNPLSPQDLHELVLGHTELAVARPELQRLYEASGGNPLFAIEIARALPRSGARLIPGEPLPIPASLAALVTARISAVSRRTRAALLIVSALAHPTVEQVRAALDRSGEQLPDTSERLLDSAEENGVVTIRDGVVRFTHSLFSSAIYAAASAAQRRRVHRSLAGIVRDAEEQAWHMALAVHGPDREVAGLVRMRWIGHALRAEADIVVDPHLTVVQAHQVAVAAEHALIHAVPRLTAATVHTDHTTHGTDPHQALAHHAHLSHAGSRG